MLNPIRAKLVRGDPSGRPVVATYHLHLLQQRTYEVIDYLMAGCTVAETAQLLGMGKGVYGSRRVRGHVYEALRRIGGQKMRERPETFQECVRRVVVWRAMQVGVMQHYAGMRGPDGVLFPEYEVPDSSERHVHYDLLFPRRMLKCLEIEPLGQESSTPPIENSSED